MTRYNLIKKTFKQLDVNDFILYFAHFFLGHFILVFFFFFFFLREGNLRNFIELEMPNWLHLVLL